MIDLAPTRDRHAGRDERPAPAREGGTDPPRMIGHPGRQRRHEVLTGTDKPAKETTWII